MTVTDHRIFDARIAVGATVASGVIIPRQQGVSTADGASQSGRVVGAAIGAMSEA